STVSGLTMTMASNTEGNRWYNQTKNNRSMFRKRTRFRDLRLNTSSCWRRTRISASRAPAPSNTERRASKTRVTNANIARCSNTLAVDRHADDVLTSDRCSLLAGLRHPQTHFAGAGSLAADRSTCRGRRLRVAEIQDRAKHSHPIQRSPIHQAWKQARQAPYPSNGSGKNYEGSVARYSPHDPSCGISRANGGNQEMGAPANFHNPLARGVHDDHVFVNACLHV